MSINREHTPKNIKITIDKFTIHPKHVMDFQIKYSLESVLPFGHIDIADAISMEEQMFQDGNKLLTLDITDALDRKYHLQCRITGGHQIRAGGRDTAIRLELLEDQSLKLSNLFLGKGYQVTTIGNLLTEYLDEIKGDKSLDIESNNMLFNFAVPVNKPFTQMIEYFREKYSLYIYRGKNKFICKDINYILGGLQENRTEDLIYGLRPNNPKYYYSIKDIKVLKTNRTKVNTALPNSKTFYSDLLNKEIQTFDYSFSKALDDISTTGGGLEEASIPDSLYYKALMRDENADITTKGYHFRTIQDMKAIEIVVSSTVDLDPGTVVNLDLDAGNGVFNKKILEKSYKGDWIVHTVTEKLSEGMILQKLLLIKPKN